MKEKIDRFSKGDFEYEPPYICMSEEEILISVEAGRISEESFTISNSAGRSMKGVIYSSSQLLSVENGSFEGDQNTITYQFNATFLKAGETVSGQINIVSDCGEKSIPFVVTIELSYCMTSLGKIKDLFQFTNLARMDWSEAKKVFRSEDFERIFLKNEESYPLIYRNLIKSVSTSQALEEFLIAIHKKSGIRLKIDKTQMEYQVGEESIIDKLTLTKDHWGYAEIRVSTNASFIQLEQKFVWADRFIGNTHQISYTIDPCNLRNGNNFGQIWIKTAHQTITIDILCKYNNEKQHMVQDYRKLQQTEFAFIENYLNFRLNKIDLIRYMEAAESLLEEWTEHSDSSVQKLVKTHLAIISGKSKIVEEFLNEFEKDEIAIKRKSALEYSTYLYLNALYRKDDTIINNAAEIIRHYYENGHCDWRILWLLLYTDKRYEANKNLKLVDIKEQFNSGCHSPILYYEAVCIFNEEPVLLRELSDFELQVINYGIKNWILSKDAATQYTYLANKKKTFNQVIFHDLVKLYDEYNTPEILAAICCILIKGFKKSPKYFEWYRHGVEAQLRITELYEYYIYSYDDSNPITDASVQMLPQPVLLYFIYNSSLNDEKKAFLYANIIKNKDKNEPIYRTYSKRIEVFAIKMLESHQVSHNLVVLYNEFFILNLQNTDIANYLPYVVYRHEVVCNNPNIVSISVVHKEIGVEENVALTEGKALVNIYTKNAEIFLLDTYGNRFVESIEYKVVPLMNSEEYENFCMEYSNNPMLLLHLFDRYQSHRIINEKAIILRKQVLSMEGLAKEYVTDCYQTLIEYYCENYDDEQLEYYLDRINLLYVRPGERIKLLEYMVARSFYNKVLEVFNTFGFEGISISRLVKLCSGWMLTLEAEKKNPLMLSLCHYVFSKGKYDDAILNYLIRYYEGSTREMFLLWQAARGFELETHDLEERLLLQMLFAESYIEDSFRVFNNYYKEVTNHTLILAFLSFYAYKYLLHDRAINSQLFVIIRRELNYEENDICKLAWLNYNSSNKKLTNSEISFAELAIDYFVKKGIILDFFQDYKKILHLPERIIDKCFMFYKTDPGRKVYIHYRLLKAKEQEYITEKMKNIFMGIRSKEFVLFYHESVQYYITEEIEEENVITESSDLQYDCEPPEDDESKYSQINLMLMALEMKEENTVLDMMENYIKKDYLIDNCFQRID